MSFTWKLDLSALGKGREASGTSKELVIRVHIKKIKDIQVYIILKYLMKHTVVVSSELVEVFLLKSYFLFWHNKG